MSRGRFIRQPPCGAPAQDAVHLLGTMRIGMLGENAAERSRSPISRAPAARQLLHQFGDVAAVSGDQHFFSGFQEELDALPVVGDQAGAGARGLEDAGCRREAVFGHCWRVEIFRTAFGVVLKALWSAVGTCPI